MTAKAHSYSCGQSSDPYSPVVKPLAIACIAAMGLGQVPAFAQQAGVEEEVIVTGSRVQVTSGMETPQPVTSVTSEELNLMAPGNIIEALSQLPLFYNNTSANDPGSFFTRRGSGNLNLRGIGTNRTLVLLDGRRVVGTSRFGGTDISVFPEALIQSIDTVTGGAAAAYGTDAITGAVNFVLDTDFEGIKGNIQSGTTSREDGDLWEASFTAGAEIGERQHILFSAEHFEQDGIHTYEGRDWYQNWGWINVPGGPTRVHAPNVVFKQATYNGLIGAPGTPLHNLNFNQQGTAATPFNFTGDPGLFQSIAGNTGSGDDFTEADLNLASDFERENQFLRYEFEINDNVTIFGQALRGESFTHQLNQVGQFNGPFSAMQIYSGNPFIPASIQQVMDDNGIEQFQLRKMGNRADLSRDGSFDYNSTFTSQTIGVEVELSGDGIFDGWSLDAWAQQGESDTVAKQNGGLRLDRFHLAHDAVIDPATGATVCNVTLVTAGALFPDCVPLNPFGTGNMSAEAVDWVTGFDAGQRITTPIYYAQQGFDLGVTDTYISEESRVTRSDLYQDVWEISMTGDIFEDRRNGPLSVAFGAGYREEGMNQIARTPVFGYTAPDGTVLSTGIADGNHDSGRPVPINYAPAGIRGIPGGDINNSVVIQYSKIPNVIGEMDVSEVFGEVFVPVLADNRLNVNVSARHADYSGSGGVWAYKVGLTSQLTDTLRLRTTASHDVRAGTLSERFDQTGGAASVMDPFRGNIDTQIFRTTGGNPAIKPEESDTITLGFIWQPTSALSLSVDWIEVDLVDAIQELTPQQIMDQCFIGDISLCGLITRQPPGPGEEYGPVNVVSANFLNVAKANVSGVDMEVQWRKDVDWFGGGEQFSIRALTSHLSENSTQGFQSPVIDRAGQTYGLFEYPTDKLTAQFNYRRGAFSAFLQVRWIDEGLRDALWVEGVDIDDNTIDSVTYTDLNFNFEVEAGDSVLDFFANITNLLDEDPPIAVNCGFFFGNCTQANAGLYDVLGRRYTFGVRLAF